MNKQHKHAELIIAWANGAEIEFYSESNREWFCEPKPNWVKSLEYRVKPKVKWEPKYTLPMSYANDMSMCMDIRVPKKVWAYDTIQQFVNEHDNNSDYQYYEIRRSVTGFYRHQDCTYSPPSVCAIRMSKECAEKLCEMLNNREIEL